MIKETQAGIWHLILRNNEFFIAVLRFPQWKKFKVVFEEIDFKIISDLLSYFLSLLFIFIKKCADVVFEELIEKNNILSNEIKTR